MSEDTPPPALRLKPRLRPSEEPAAGGAQPASPPPDAPPASPATPAPAESASAEGGAPRLRLKPKLSAEPAAAQPAQPVAAEAPVAAPAATPEPAPAAPAPEAAQPERPRLKPRLTVEPAAAPAQAAEPAPAAAPAPEPVAAAPTPPPPAPAPEPPPAPKPAEAPAAEGSKFKLKPKAPPAAAPAAAAPSAPPPPVTAPKPATRPPMVPAAAPAAATATPPPVAPPPLAPKVAPPPTVEAKESAAEAPPPVEAAPPAADNGKKKKVLTLVIGIAAVAVLAAAGYIAWVFFVAPPSPAPEPATPVAKAPVPAEKPAAVTPSETLNQIAAAPKQMIDKAQDVVAARRELEQDRVDAVLEGKEPPDKRFLDTPLPGHLGGKSAPAPAPTQTVVKTESQLAPGIKVTTSDLTASAPVSEEFRAFVSAARINGVFQGNPPRALINGRTIRAGEAADTVLGIVFESVDPEKKTITFKDRTGATITRKY